MDEERLLMEEKLLRVSRAKSPEEVKAIAREYGYELPEEEAQQLFEFACQQNEGELSDDELENIAGGNIFDKMGEFFGGFFKKKKSDHSIVDDISDWFKKW